MAGILLKEEKIGDYSISSATPIDENTMQELEVGRENSKLLLSPEFIPFYPAIKKLYGFNELETVLYGFIRFFLHSVQSGSMYVTNQQLALMLGKHEVSISKAMQNVLICGEFKVDYKVRANGGKVRLIKNANSDLAKTLTLTKRKRYDNKNKVRENKINNIYTQEIEISNMELQEVVSYYNQVYMKNVQSIKPLENNFSYWRKTHTLEKIRLAISNGRLDKFWKDKLTLTILFRKKNPQGENVDYIEDLSNRTVSTPEDNFIVIGNGLRSNNL